MAMRTTKEMNTTEQKAKVSRGANFVLWIGFLAMAGLSVSGLFMKDGNQETCLHIGLSLVCAAGLVWALFAKK